MTHEEIKILISAYFDGEVTPSEKTIVEEHLSSCPSCQKDYKTYMAMSSSLSKWSDETLSPDEEIKVQKRFEQRREPMFTTRTMMALGTTLALTIIIGSVVQTYVKRGLQGRFKSSTDDIGDQYSVGNIFQLQNRHAAEKRIGTGLVAEVFNAGVSSTQSGRQSTQYEPYYLQETWDAGKKSVENQRLGQGLVAAGAFGGNYAKTRTGAQEANYSTSDQGAPAAASYALQASLKYEQKSGVDLNSTFTSDRKIIKNADITLKVENAEKAQTELEGLVTKYSGIVVNFNINQTGDGSRRGNLVFKVYPEDLDTVMRELRRLGEVQSENQYGSDITNQYKFLKTQLENSKALRERLKKVLAKNVNNVDNNLTIEGQISDAEANINNFQSTLKNLDEQSFMASVNVSFYDTIKTEIKEIGLKDKMITISKNNFKNTLQTCWEIGLNTLSGIIIVVSFLVPVVIWTLIFWGVYLVVRKFFKK